MAASTGTGTEGLDVEHDEPFERREWRVESVGWGVLALFIVAALSGLLGAGPASWSQRTSGDGGLSVRYQRVTHLQADDRLEVLVRQGPARADAVLVELTGSWVDAIEVRRMSPQPLEEHAAPGALRLRMAAQDGTVRLRLAFHAGQAGWQEARVSAAGASVQIRQFVLP
jgi:hypothetical protein